MTHENKNIGGGAEHPGSEEQMISAMLTGLKRVEAPKDFDLHLRAKIANARPADYQRTSLFPILKYAMPLGLFLAVGTSIILYSSYQAPKDLEIVEQASSGVTTTASSSDGRTIQPPTNVSSQEQRRADSPAPEVPLRDSELEKPRLASNPSPARGGSRDFRTSGPRMPPGNFADLTVKGSDPALTPKGMPLKRLNVNEAFKLIDADASFENGSWTIKSVAAKGVADQIGMKAGDKLVGVDGKAIKADTQFDSKFSAGTIQVQRGETTVDLGLNRKPVNR